MDFACLAEPGARPSHHERNGDRFGHNELDLEARCGELWEGNPASQIYAAARQICRTYFVGRKLCLQIAYNLTAVCALQERSAQRLETMPATTTRPRCLQTAYTMLVTLTARHLSEFQYNSNTKIRSLSLQCLRFHALTMTCEIKPKHKTQASINK